MTDALVVLCTFPDEAKARQIGTQLVERQCVACATFLPSAESIYQWEGKLCQERETLVLFKTSRGAYPLFQRELLALHPYETPEIVAIPVVDGSPQYLQWLLTQAR